MKKRSFVASSLAGVALLVAPLPAVSADMPSIVSVSAPPDSSDLYAWAFDKGIYSITFPIKDPEHIGIGYLVEPEPFHRVWSPMTDFVMHDHMYVAPGVPDPRRASITYRFDAPAKISEVLIVQHTNGIAQIEGFIGDDEKKLKSIGFAHSTLGANFHPGKTRLRKDIATSSTSRWPERARCSGWSSPKLLCRMAMRSIGSIRGAAITGRMMFAAATKASPARPSAVRRGARRREVEAGRPAYRSASSAASRCRQRCCGRTSRLQGWGRGRWENASNPLWCEGEGGRAPLGHQILSPQEIPMKTLTTIQALAILAALGSAILGSATPADARGGDSFGARASFARPSFARPSFGMRPVVIAARQQPPAVIAAQLAHPGHVNPGSTSMIADTPDGPVFVPPKQPSAVPPGQPRPPAPR